MRDRLIEWIKQGDKAFADKYTGKVMSHIDEVYEFVADYLLESGVIVPPCKVGDTVYEFFDVKGFYDISELIVENIVVGVNPPKCNIYTKSNRSGSKEVFYKESFGETLFFTKEEAEQALKGGAK